MAARTSAPSNGCQHLRASHGCTHHGASNGCQHLRASNGCEHFGASNGCQHVVACCPRTRISGFCCHRLGSAEAPADDPKLFETVDPDVKEVVVPAAILLQDLVLQPRQQRHEVARRILPARRDRLAPH